MLSILLNSSGLFTGRTRQSFANVAVLFAVCFLFNVSGVYAATFVVNSTADANDVTAGNGVCATATGVCTLRAAITEANALAGDDIITLPAGDYTQTLTGVEDLNATADLDITSNITINGAGSGTTNIQANAAAGVAIARVFDFPNANVTVIINGVTIRNGRQAAAAIANFGGGVRVNAAGDNVTFNNCVISANFSGNGGGGIGINNATAVVTLNGTTVTANSTTGANGGGGVNLNASGATFNATNSTISNNTASSTAATQYGGGIENFGGNVTLTGSTVSGNTNSAAGGSALGGGIDTSGVGTVTLTNSTVSGNTATAAGANTSLGGGINQLAGTLNITGSTISGNNSASTGTGAAFAGGIYNQQSVVNLTNSTVSGNTAPIHAGIRTLAGTTVATTTITQSAVVNNTSVVEGGGVINLSSGAAAATTNISNSTVGGNMSAGSAGGIENFNTAAGAAIVNINYSTVAGNAANTDNTGADSGGGVGNFGGGTGASTINLISSIVADNTIGTGGTGPDIFGVITSGGYNHVENIAGSTFAVMVGDVTGTDPGLTALALNGGTTLNYLPGAGSPVLDTIPTGVNGCGTAPFNVDQRGALRPTDSDNNAVAACEKGSIEVAAPSAAMASVSGRVLEGADGKRGVHNAIVTMTDAGGVTRQTRTNAFGYFQLDDVAVGQTYIFDVSAKRFQFLTQVVNVNNDLTGVTFTPLYQKIIQ